MTKEAKQCVEIIRHCSTGNDGNHCKECPYLNSDTLEKPCVNILFSDAADLIESLSGQLEQVTRERDAAVKCLSEFAPCSECACYKDNGGNCSGELYCKSHDTGFAWQWRGVQEVEG